MERAPSRHDDTILLCCPETHPRLTVTLPAAEVPSVQNSQRPPNQESISKLCKGRNGTVLKLDID